MRVSCNMCIIAANNDSWLSWLSGSEVVVEEFLDGEEASFFALIDGENCVALASAQVMTVFMR